MRPPIEGLAVGSLVLVHDGRIAAEHGVGVANAETQAPVATDRTLYQVASVKQSRDRLGA